MASRRKPNYEMYNYLNEISMFHSLDYLVNLINEKFEENYDKKSLRQYLIRNRIPYKKMKIWFAMSAKECRLALNI